MVAAPTVWAVLADVVWCLGLGCVLGAARDAVGLLFGNGPVRCFVWDVLAFAAAAVLLCGFSAGVSASGVARWYMAGALLAGAAAWQQAVQPAVHQVLYGVLHLVIWPFRAADRCLFRPVARRVSASLHDHALRRRQKKAEKKAKNGKKQLQKSSKIVYN